MKEVQDIRRSISEKIFPGGLKQSIGNMMEKNEPIGVFDSGVGGLTTLKEIMNQLPHEDIVYLADTANLPYGGRPADEITQINKKIMAFFEKQKVKMVIMACGTSSAIAHPILKDNYKFPIISLIEPGSRQALSATRNKKIGVIATLGTVNSQAYEKTLKGLDSDVQVFQSACPLFVPLIEGGFIDAQETRKVSREYLAPLLKEGVDAIILGCTHYPHLLPVLKEITGPDISFVDPSENAVFIAKQELEKHDLLNKGIIKGKYKYFVTGSVSQFEELGSRLLGRPITQAKQAQI